MSFIGAYWRGEKPLWKAYWIWGFFMQAFINNIIFIGIFLLAGLIKGLTGVETLGIAILTSIAYLLFYMIWNGVSIWRCAKNSDFIWAFLARLYTIFYIPAIFSLIFLLFFGIFKMNTITTIFESEFSKIKQELKFEKSKEPTKKEPIVYEEIDLDKLEVDERGYTTIPDLTIKTKETSETK